MDEEDETPILEVDLIQTHSIKFLKEESNRLLFKLENRISYFWPLSKLAFWLPLRKF